MSVVLKEEEEDEKENHKEDKELAETLEMLNECNEMEEKTNEWILRKKEKKAMRLKWTKKEIIKALVYIAMIVVFVDIGLMLLMIAYFAIIRPLFEHWCNTS
ncbi:MAG: hypothetical protein ACTSUE_13960 [Promethearchaeota archaeon]